MYKIFTIMLFCFHASHTYEINSNKCIDNVHVRYAIVNEPMPYTPVYKIFTVMSFCFHASLTYEINSNKCIDNVFHSK